MNRLTKMLKELVLKYPEIDDTIWYYDFKKYADIEEELGIDLITLFEAINKGIYIKTDKVEFMCLWFDNIDATNSGEYFWELFGDVFYFKDYGKTWALTKEELE